MNTTSNSIQPPPQLKSHLLLPSRPGLHVSSTSSRRTKPAEITVQLQYAKELANASRYFRDVGGLVYEWRGNHFAEAPQDERRQHAFRWLASHHPSKATPETAASCASAAEMEAPRMPTFDQSRIVIPLSDAYLEVKTDGSIVRHAPDKKFGLKHVLAVKLGASAGSGYVPAAVPAGSRLDTFLQTSLPDQEVRDFLQELAGNTLTTSAMFQVAMLLKGNGSNGKSVFMKCLSALHSPRVASLRLNQLCGFQLTTLVGASLVVVDEVPKVGIDEQMLKALISGEQVTIDRKHRDPVSYMPTAKWVIATNNDQKMSDNSHGLWRRLVTVPFDQQFSASDIVYGLDRLIIDSELQLFLDWCLAGLQRLMKRGHLPSEPAQVAKAKREAMEASNSVAAWCSEEEVHVATGPLVAKDDLYAGYREWCSRQGLRPVASTLFWKGLRELLTGLVEEQRRIPGGRRVRFVNIRRGCDELVNPFAPV